MWVGDGEVVGVDWGREGKGKGRRKNMIISRAGGYVRCFNDFRQGARQSDCVMLFGAWLGITRVGGSERGCRGGWLGCEGRGRFWGYC